MNWKLLIVVLQSTIYANKRLIFSELVETAVKLNLKDFEAFLLSVNTRRAQLRPHVLSKKESDLMKKIYFVFPEEKKSRVALKMNRKQLVNLRKALVLPGVHPPKD